MVETIYCIQYYSEKIDKWCDSLFDSNITSDDMGYKRLSECRRDFHYRHWRLVKKVTSTEVLDMSV